MGKSADEADAEKIIEMASKTSFADQQTQVQENVHSQIGTFCAFMDEILLPNEKMVNDPLGLSQQGGVFPRRSGLSFAVGRGDSPPDNSGEHTPSLLVAFCNRFFFYETSLLVNKYSHLGFSVLFRM